MSRYLLLFILNIPFVVIGVGSSYVDYKLSSISRINFVYKLIFWLVILVGITFAEPAYNYLIAAGKTNTDPLSLFDVVQISAIVLILFITNRNHQKIDALERRLLGLHQEISIKLSGSNNGKH